MFPGGADAAVIRLRSQIKPDPKANAGTGGDGGL